MSSLSSRLSSLEHGLVVVLTGAGLSAESGIPTFRGEEGYWTVGSTNYHPMELATNQAFRTMPEAVWCWYLYRRTVCNRARPSAGHRILAGLEERLGDRFLLVTQNVDGLHLRAGSSMERTHQIHGNINFMRCFNECCSDLVPIPERIGDMERGGRLGPNQKSLLVCPTCGGLARPHVLWFDETYDEPRFRFESSLRAALECAVLISVGSSGSTNLPNQMVRAASARGALLIDINPEPNPFSRVAEGSGGVWLRESAGEGLGRVAEAWSAV